VPPFLNLAAKFAAIEDFAARELVIATQ
jgi:hypothetical protein